jgi:hypothetical protein
LVVARHGYGATVSRVLAGWIWAAASPRMLATWVTLASFPPSNLRI